MSTKDPYEILGVGRNATPAEIKRSYRRLAKEHHPDRHAGDKRAEEKFKEIQAAYEVLGDPQRRAQYDQFGAGGPIPEFQSWGAGGPTPFGGVQFDFASGGGDLTGIFEQFFGGGRTRGARRRTASRRRARGANLEHAVELTFEEAIAGTRREVVLSSGANGSSERIEFRVPAGIADGQVIRVKGKGQDGAGGRGDLMIRCRVVPHPYFRRDGLDLLFDLPLSVTEAALGAKIEIQTLSGSTRLTVPPGAGGGTKLRLRGKGLRDERTGRTGDLYAVVQIKPPKELSARARELLEALSDELTEDPRRGLGWASRGSE